MYHHQLWRPMEAFRPNVHFGSSSRKQLAVGPKQATAQRVFTRYKDASAFVAADQDALTYSESSDILGQLQRAVVHNAVVQISPSSQPGISEPYLHHSPGQRLAKYRRKRHIALMDRIRTADSVAKLRSLCNANASKLNALHITATFCRVVQLGAHASEPQVKQYLDGLVALAGARLRFLPARQVANLLWACVMLDYGAGSTTYGILLDKCYDCMCTFGPEQLSNVLWAASDSRFCPPTSAWLHRFYHASATLLPHFSPKELSITLWALAKLLQQPPVAWMNAWLGSSQLCMSDWNAQDFATALLALGSMHQPPGPQWLALVLAHSSNCLPQASAQSLWVLLSALGKLGCSPSPAWLAALDSRLLALGSELSPECASGILSSRAWLNAPPSKSTLRILTAAVAATHQLEPLRVRAAADMGLALAATPCAKAKAGGEQAATRLAVQTDVHALWALSALGVQPEAPWLAAWFARVQARMPHMCPKTLGVMSRGLLGARLAPQAPWLQDFCEHTVRQLPDLPPQTLCCILAYVARLDLPVADAWLHQLVSAGLDRLTSAAAATSPQERHDHMEEEGEYDPAALLALEAWGLHAVAAPTRQSGPTEAPAHVEAAVAGTFTPMDAVSLVGSLALLQRRGLSTLAVQVLAAAEALIPQFGTRGLTSMLRSAAEVLMAAAVAPSGAVALGCDGAGTSPHQAVALALQPWVAAVHARLEVCNGQDLAWYLQALASVQYPVSQSEREAVMAECERRMSSLEAVELSSILAHMAQLRLPAPSAAWTRHCAQRLLALAPELSGSQASLLLYALGRMGAAPGNNCPATLAHQLQRHSAALSPHDLSSGVWGAAKVGYTLPQECWRPLVQAAAGKINTFSPRELSMFVHGAALAQLNIPASLVRDVWERLDDLLPDCSMRHITVTLWSLAGVVQPPPPAGLLARVVKRLGPLLPSAKPQELALCMWALAKVRARPGPQWLKAVEAVLARSMHGSSTCMHTAQGLAYVTWAFAVMAHQPDAQLLHGMVQRLLPLLPHCRPTHLAMFVWALQSLQYWPDRAVLAALAVATRRCWDGLSGDTQRTLTEIQRDWSLAAPA